MSPISFFRFSGLAVFSFALLIAFALAPSTARSAGSAMTMAALDVPFVPTPHEVVDKMLQMADVNSSDFLIDLGAGDGRIAVAAVRDHGAKGAFGVDIDPKRVEEARANAEEAGVADKVKFEVQDLFETDFSKATVVSMYLLPKVNLRLRPKVLEMAPGTRIVSHAFDMGDWEPDAREDVGGRNIFFWVVPARVEGQWRITGPDGDLTVDLQQDYQKLTGTAVGADNQPLPLTGTLRGDVIQLDIDSDEAAPRRYVGRVQGDSMVAQDDDEAIQGWRASRL